MKKLKVVIYALALTVTVNAQNVGIGTTTPSAKLHVGAGTRYGLAEIGSIFLQSGTGVGSARDWKMYVPMTSGNLAFRDMGFDNQNNGMAGDAMVIQFVTGNVGIGTETPGAKLEVNGSLKITDGNQGAGKVLTSDANGLGSWLTPTAPAFIFSTDQSVGNNYYIGVGTSGTNFLRNSVVVPFDCYIGSLIFSIRSAAANTGITATLYKSSNGIMSATTLSTVIANGATQVFAVTNSLVPLLQGDLISINLSWSTGGSLANGTTVTLTYK